MLSIKVTIEDNGLKRDLETVAKRAVPHAIRNGLNAIAFEGRKLWQAELGSKLILRNDWTTRRILVEKAKGTDVQSMQSVLRSPDEYLEKQEKGGTEKHAVPTGVATGEGRGANPRKRLVRRPNQVSAITLGTRARTGGRKQRNAAAIRIAAAQGKKFVFLELQKRKGLFKIKGGKRRPMVDMVWDTTKKAHRVNPTPTLGPAVRKLEQRAPALMRSAFVDQLRRHKAFGY